MRVSKAILVLVMILFASLSHAERFAVTASVANVRSGPGTQYDVIWKIEKYHPILVIHKTNPWYQFTDFEGDQGWVHKSLVDKVKTVMWFSLAMNIGRSAGQVAGQ